MKGCVWICAVGEPIMWAKHVGEVWQWSGGTCASAFLAAALFYVRICVLVCLATIRKSRAEDAGNFEGQVDLQKWGIYIRQYGM